MVDRPAAYRPRTKKSTLLRPEIYAENQRNPLDAGNVGRKLIVCIDGTSNQYSEKNTNVIELYSHIEKSSTQLTYYNSGIGTYAKPSWQSISHWKQVVYNLVDLAIAWNLERVIIGAYRWLSDNYQEGDEIFLFGFSRGAYQVRALAGMIERVGLIYAGNQEQIPFAYELYAQSRTDDESKVSMFKQTFSRDDVRVQFLGVWDTVSSVGLFRGRLLPLTDSCNHVVRFRHALALDERRVKFLPEYAIQVDVKPKEDTDVKEVWFAGTHSDIGGGNLTNLGLDRAGEALTWMVQEAEEAGLKMDAQAIRYGIDNADINESLGTIWWLFEMMPFSRPTYQLEGEVTYRPHCGSGRVILEGQKVHMSVAYRSTAYTPKAVRLECGKQLPWAKLVTETDRKHGPKDEAKWEGSSNIFNVLHKIRSVEPRPEEDKGDRWLNEVLEISKNESCAEMIWKYGGLEFLSKIAKFYDETKVGEVVWLVLGWRYRAVDKPKYSIAYQQDVAQRRRHIDEVVVPRLLELLNGAKNMFERETESARIRTLMFDVNERNLGFLIVVFHVLGHIWGLLAGVFFGGVSENTCTFEPTNVSPNRTLERVAVRMFAQLLKIDRIEAMLEEGAISYICSLLKADTKDSESLGLIQAAMDALTLVSEDDLARNQLIEDDAMTSFAQILKFSNLETVQEAVCAIAAMAAHWNTSRALVNTDAVGTLSSFLAPGTFAISGPQALFEAAIITHTLCAVANFAKIDDARSQLLDHAAMESIVSLLSHAQLGQLSNILDTVSQLSKYKDTRDALVEAGLIETLDTFLAERDSSSSHGDEAGLVEVDPKAIAELDVFATKGLSTMRSMIQYGNARARMSQGRIISHILQLLDNCNTPLGQEAFNVINSLTRYGDVTKGMVDQSIVPQVVSLLAENITDALDVIHNLVVNDQSVVVSIDAEAVQHILDLAKSRPQDVLPKIGMLIRHEKSRLDLLRLGLAARLCFLLRDSTPHAIKHACFTIRDLFDYGDARANLIHQGVFDALFDAMEHTGEGPLEVMMGLVYHSDVRHWLMEYNVIFNVVPKLNSTNIVVLQAVTGLLYYADIRAELLQARIVPYLCESLDSKIPSISYSAYVAVTKLADDESLRAELITKDLLLWLVSLLAYRDNTAQEILVELIKQDKSRIKLVKENIAKHLIKAAKYCSIQVLAVTEELARHENSISQLLEEGIMYKLCDILEKGRVQLVREALRVIAILVTHDTFPSFVDEDLMLNSLVNVLKDGEPLGLRIIVLLAAQETTRRALIDRNLLPLVLPFLKRHGKDSILAVTELLTYDDIRIGLLDQNLVPAIQDLINQGDEISTYGALCALKELAMHRDSRPDIVYGDTLECVIQFLKIPGSRLIANSARTLTHIFETSASIVLTLSSYDDSRNELLRLGIAPVLLRFLASANRAKNANTEPNSSSNPEIQQGPIETNVPSKYDMFNSCQMACLDVIAKLSHHDDSGSILVTEGLISEISLLWGSSNEILSRIFWPLAIRMVDFDKGRKYLCEHNIVEKVVDCLVPKRRNFIIWQKILPMTLQLFDKLIDHDDTRKQLATEKIAGRFASLLERLSMWSYRLSALKNGQARLDAVQLPILRSISRVAVHDDAREWLLGIKYFEPLAAGGCKELQETTVEDYVIKLSQVIPDIRVYSSKAPHLR